MTIKRGGRVVFRGKTRTSLIRFPLPYLHRYLQRYNTVPAGTVALTGTGIMTPAGFGLKPGDEVAINAAGIGTLVNIARLKNI
jgi:2-dehydro-3-deoxy-D-arabinonate dehydratase